MTVLTAESWPDTTAQFSAVYERIPKTTKNLAFIKSSMQGRRTLDELPPEHKTLVEQLLQDPQIKQLWNGDLTPAGNDDSKADFMVSCAIARRLRDPEQIETILRCSPGLYRDKWDRPEYLPMTIAAALAETPTAQETFADKDNTGTDTNGAAETAKHPVLKLNDDHAFTMVGNKACVLWQTVDADGRDRVEYLPLPAFRDKYAPQTITIGKTSRPIADEWLKDERRREYDGVVFRPEQPVPPRYFNLWKGFKYAPAPKGATHPAVEQWKEHAHRNVSGGESQLTHWNTSWLAQLIQCPGEKPTTALALRGDKGVGKNAFIEPVSALFGPHAMTTSDKRYLTGNFNSHLERCLLIIFDEAFWSGDKQAEGKLKDLISGKEHIIERKGFEPYAAKNLTRVVILGNEDWIVPATHDERRFTVMEVGDGRKQDTVFFGSMMRGMEAGGYAVLLRYLLDYEPELVDLNTPPKTAGLRVQQDHSRPPLEQWWQDCVLEGRLLSADGVEGWPEAIECERFRRAFRRYAQERNIKGWIPADNAIGRLMKKFAPGFDRGKITMGTERPTGYHLPKLAEARACWAKHIGSEIEWPEQ